LGGFKNRKCFQKLGKYISDLIPPKKDVAVGNDDNSEPKQYQQLLRKIQWMNTGFNIDITNFHQNMKLINAKEVDVFIADHLLKYAYDISFRLQEKKLNREDKIICNTFAGIVSNDNDLDEE
jgi:hypothetical protein